MRAMDMGGKGFQRRSEKEGLVVRDNRRREK